MCRQPQCGKNPCSTCLADTGLQTCYERSRMILLAMYTCECPGAFTARVPACQAHRRASRAARAWGSP